jgi:hypothetical protein
MTFDQHLFHAAGTARLDFAWDEWRIHEDYAASTTGYEARLGKLSDAANLALGIALAEWITVGLERFDEDRIVGQYVQSAWAAFLESASPTYFETDDDDWRGPCRGLLNMTLIILNDAIFCRDESPDVWDRCNQLLYYAQLLFAHSDLFVSWLDVSLARIEAIDAGSKYSGGLTDLPIRPVIPRDIFDQNTVTQTDATTLIERYLNQVARDNPFIDFAQ